MGFLENKKRARIFYKYFSIIYDSINPIFYSKEMRRTVIDMAEIKKGDKVLEIGCGTGFTTEEIVRRIGENYVFAVDITPEQMKKAVRKFPKVNFVRGDAENLPFKDNTFDSSISAGSIEYWPNPLRGIMEMKRVTKSDGRVVILAPRKPENFLARKIAESFMLFPSTQQCISWFKKAGLKDIKFVEIGPYFFWSKLVVVISGKV